MPAAYGDVIYFGGLGEQWYSPSGYQHGQRCPVRSERRSGGRRGPIDVVQMILGHASPAVTRQVYAHIIKRAASEQVDRAM